MISAAILLTVALQLGDGITTACILRLGGVELNPLLRLLMRKVGHRVVLVGKTLLVVGVLLGSYWLDFFDRAPWAILMIAGWSAAVLINNIVVIARLGRGRDSDHPGPGNH